MYADAAADPSQWSAKKSFDLTRIDVQIVDAPFARPIYIKAYAGSGESKQIKASKMSEFDKFVEHFASEASLTKSSGIIWEVVGFNLTPV